MTDDVPTDIQKVLADPMDSPQDNEFWKKPTRGEDKQVDRFGRDYVFKSPPVYVDGIGPYHEIADRTTNPYGPHIRPNRAARRAAKIRTPLIQLDAHKAYMDILAETFTEDVNEED